METARGAYLSSEKYNSCDISHVYKRVISVSLELATLVFTALQFSNPHLQIGVSSTMLSQLS